MTDKKPSTSREPRIGASPAPIKPAPPRPAPSRPAGPSTEVQTRSR